jgi:hypothetical protein
LTETEDRPLGPIDRTELQTLVRRSDRCLARARPPRLKPSVLRAGASSDA